MERSGGAILLPPGYPPPTAERGRSLPSAPGALPRPGAAAAARAADGGADPMAPAIATDAAAAAADATRRAAEATEAAALIDSALTPEGFDADRIVILIDESRAPAAQKTALRALVDAAKGDETLRASVLEQVRAALR